MAGELELLVRVKVETRGISSSEDGSEILYERPLSRGRRLEEASGLEEGISG